MFCTTAVRFRTARMSLTVLAGTILIRTLGASWTVQIRWIVTVAIHSRRILIIGYVGIQVKTMEVIDVDRLSVWIWRWHMSEWSIMPIERPCCLNTWSCVERMNWNSNVTSDFPQRESVYEWRILLIRAHEAFRLRLEIDNLHPSKRGFWRFMFVDHLT